MQKKSILFFFLFFILIFTSCSPVNKVTEMEPTPEAVVPAAKDETGVVHGYLLSPNNEPVNESIYLTRDIAYDQPDLPVTVVFSYQSDLRGTINAQTGMFTFENVEPGENYVFAILTGSAEPIFIMDETGDQPMVFAVSAGETVDLGKIIIDIQN